MLNINKVSRTILNGISQKSQQPQFADIRKMVSVDPASNILTCASQNKLMDEEKAKLVAVKIIQTYRQLMKRQSSSLSITFRRFFSVLDNSALKIGNCCRLVLLSVRVFECFLRLFIKKFSGQDVVKLRCK